MISRITLERFRGYRGPEPLELKPLTVLLGPNSAGKSSFLQALAALRFVRHLHMTPATLSPPRQMDAAWPFDFGGRLHLQTDGTLSDGGVKITLTVPRPGRIAEVSYEFGVGESLDLSAVQVTDDVEPTQVVSGVVAQRNVIDAPLYPLFVEQRPGEQEHKHQDGNIGVRRLHERDVWVADGRPVTVGLVNLRLDLLAFPTGTLQQIKSSAQTDVLEALSHVRYLRASRANPSRGRDARPEGEARDDVGPSGEWTGDTWLATKGDAVEFREPPPARIDREAAAKMLDGTAKPESVTLQVALDRWLAALRMADAGSAVGDAKVSMLARLHGRDRQLPDLGYGVSQILPVLVQALALPPDGTLLVEQPEGQLHPRPQARLADFFCDLVLRGRNAIVETHSESFFRRLHLRALLDPALRERVAVYFVDPAGPDGCSKPRPVALDKDGPPTWPEDFLTESVDAHSGFAAVRSTLAKRGLL